MVGREPLRALTCRMTPRDEGQLCKETDIWTGEQQAQSPAVESAGRLGEQNAGLGTWGLVNERMRGGGSGQRTPDHTGPCRQ